MVACDQTETGFGTQADLYMNLVTEEYKELLEGFEKKSLVEIADACADLKWVIEGLEHSLNIPQQAVWNEVSRSNMSKISSSGKVLKRPDGKVMKPDFYFSPDIEGVLKKHGV